MKRLLCAFVLKDLHPTPYLRARYSSIKMVDYFNVAGYDEEEVLEFVTKVGWRVPENCFSTWRADCSFAELKNYLFIRHTGMTYVDAYLSNMVRAGAISRECTLERSKTEGRISQDRLIDVCETLGIPFESIQAC